MSRTLAAPKVNSSIVIVLSRINNSYIYQELLLFYYLLFIYLLFIITTITSSKFFSVMQHFQIWRRIRDKEWRNHSLYSVSQTSVYMKLNGSFLQNQTITSMYFSNGKKPRCTQSELLRKWRINSTVLTCQWKTDKFHALLAHDRPAKAAVMTSVSDTELGATVWAKWNILITDPRHNRLLYSCEQEHTPCRYSINSLPG